MEIIASQKDDALSPDAHQHLPMQSQIALMFLAIMLTLAVFASLLNSWITTTSFEAKLDEKSNRYIQSIFDEYLDNVNDVSGNHFQNKLVGILEDDDITAIGLFGSEKVTIVKMGDDKEIPKEILETNRVATPLPITIDRIRYYKFHVPAQYRNELKQEDKRTLQLETIVISVDADKVFRTALNAFVWTFLVTMATAICMMLIAVVVIRRFTEPFNKLSMAMQSAQLGERGVRVKPDGASEIYKMSMAFNAMISVLERREVRLQNQKNVLEAQVREREAAELKLKNTSSRMQAIFNNVTDGILVVDMEHKIVSANPTAKKIYGYSAGEIVGENLSHVMDDSFIKLAFPGLDEKKSGEKLASYETIAITISGKIIPTEVGVSLMSMSGEEHYLVTVRDITERVKSDQELEDYRTHLESMVQEQTKDIAESRDAAMAGERAMSTFLANMSHELRTPMHGVLSFANIALRKIDDVPVEKTKEYLSEIRTSGQHLLDIINDLLDLSKMKSGKMDYTYLEKSFINIVENVTREMVMLAENKGVTINVNVYGDEETIELDEKRMMQVLRNLYANAIKFSISEKDIKVDVDYTHHGKVIFSIFNFGVCVPVDEREHIFESFVQSSMTSTNAGGTGLGLPICKEIVEVGHGGSISTDSMVTEGARFIVEIPRCRKNLELVDDNIEMVKAHQS